MAYVGTPLDTTNAFQSLAGKRFSGDASTTGFTLDSAPNSTLDIEVFVDNVRQDPNSAYTVSGTTLTFTAAPPTGTNNIYVVHQAKSVGTIDVPSAGVQSGSLSSAFLTGQTDIGGAIADADLFLVDDGAGGTFRKTAASRLKTYIGGGITTASQWRLTSNFTGDADPIASNLEEVDAPTGFGILGSSMTESSGVFTFPSTGYWYVIFDVQFYFDGDARFLESFIKIANTKAAQMYTFVTNDGESGNNYSYASCSTIVDVTNTGTQTVKFGVSMSQQSATVGSDTDKNTTSMTFIRLGDT